jgi:hypothetical protein
MAQVFVSYAQKDMVEARCILEALEQGGLSVFRETSLAAGVSWADDVRHQIDTAKCVVVLWSQAAAESRFVQQEVAQAIQAWSDGRLVLAVLDETELPRGLGDLPATRLGRDAHERDVANLVEQVKSVAGADLGFAEATPPWMASVKKPAPPEEVLAARHAAFGGRALRPFTSARRSRCLPPLLVLALTRYEQFGSNLVEHGADANNLTAPEPGRRKPPLGFTSSWLREHFWAVRLSAPRPAAAAAAPRPVSSRPRCRTAAIGRRRSGTRGRS